MKTLITHLRPHLDDICALWLLKRYAPEAAGARLGFIPTGPKGGRVEDNPDFIYIGVGRGRFDEHKGDIGQCATTLVFNDLKKRGLVPDNELAALEKLTAWVLLDDTGRLLLMEYREFSIPRVLQGCYESMSKNSQAAAELGFAILEGMLANAQNLVRLEEDWTRRIAFTSRFGAAAALETGAKDAEAYAYARGFDIVAIVNPSKTFHNIRAKAETTIDLSPVYDELLRREPSAGWYLHHSKKLLICGGDLAPDAVASRLSLQELIELLK